MAVLDADLDDSQPIGSPENREVVAEFLRRGVTLFEWNQVGDQEPTRHPEEAIPVDSLHRIVQPGLVAGGREACPA